MNMTEMKMPDIEKLADVITEEIMKMIADSDCNVDGNINGNINGNIDGNITQISNSVICMEDVSGMTSGTLAVYENAVITPMAMDHIRDCGIRLVRTIRRK